MIDRVNPSYDADTHLAEFYDLKETQTNDVTLIRKLLSGQGPLRIFELCCGTGRILLPLAADGHQMVGIDSSQTMLDRLKGKLAAHPPELRQRVRLLWADCVPGPWPGGFDVVLLAGNCFYELASAEEQVACIRWAASSLVSGGHVLLDNDHMEGELAESWCQPGAYECYPSGRCADGTELRGTSELMWLDRPRRLVRWQRTVTIDFPDGRQVTRKFIQQKHPPCIEEMRAWLADASFTVEKAYGSHELAPLVPTSPRAILWARKTQNANPTPPQYPTRQ